MRGAWLTLAPESAWFGVALAPAVVCFALGAAGAWAWLNRAAMATLGVALLLLGAVNLVDPGDVTFWPAALLFAGATVALGFALVRRSSWRYATEDELLREAAELWPERRDRFGLAAMLWITGALAPLLAAGGAFFDGRFDFGDLRWLGLAASLLVGMYGGAIALCAFLAACTSRRVAAVGGAMALASLGLGLGVEWAMQILIVMDEEAPWSMRAYDALKPMSGYWWRWAAGVFAAVGGTLALLRWALGYSLVAWPVE